MLQRVALSIEYDGSDFHGWQRQPTVSSIQANIETALSRIANHPVNTICAGRTDAGVHATYQVIHFDTHAQRPLSAWIQGANSYLTRAIRIHHAQHVSNEFHARFSALSRTYQYLIFTGKLQPAIRRHCIYHFPKTLNIDLMNTAATYLLGEQDFSSFRTRECQSRTPMRNVQLIKIKREEEMIKLSITANAFLHHMVRKMVRVLLDVGCENKAVDAVENILQARNPDLITDLAPARGLYLVDVEYPADLIDVNWRNSKK